ncbi:condensation domain-containing protein [Streptomyces sp. NPDC005438]|uniref:amino acid adenylation domain-containing protein n=1 Tax=Streptomyces sp. NPDC005438 TaxID=3156880 RepID=UPI0033B0B0B4
MSRLTELIEETARRHPQRVAVEGPQGQLRYGELLESVREGAERLRAADTRTVAVTGDRGPLLVTAVLATVFSGARLLLVDPELPARRRESMVAEAGAGHVLTVGEGLRLERCGSGDGRGGPGGRGGYVFFTSGTTARPKAVLGRTDSLAHFVCWQRDRFGIGPGDRVAQLTALSFDVVLRDLFTPLVSGATLVVPPAGVAVDVGGVPRWLREAGVTVAHTVPSLASRWTSGEPEPVGPAGGGAVPAGGGARDRLRLTFLAGEPLSRAVVLRWREWFPNTRVVNLYGPTETTLAKFWREVTEPVPGVQPVGSPLPETEVRLVDGEVWLRTPHGTDGYLNAPEEQAARFVADERGGPPWYRTGDLGEWTADEELLLRGRRDLQVKINGNRVEPEGVAAVLREHPGVEDAVVVARRRADGADCLAAFHTVAGAAADPAGAPATGPGEEELRHWLGERLPAAQVPSLFVRLDRLPLLPNGKVDRGALPETDTARVGAGPEDETQRRVLDAFAEVLPAGHLDADFFALGGTSLDAAELAHRLLTGTGRRVEMSELYRLRTPRAVAERVRGRAPDRQAPIPTRPRSEQPTTTGLSPQQRRYRRVYAPRINRTWANMVALFPLPEDTSAGEVREALEATVRRQDALCAYFSEDAGGRLTQHFVTDPSVAVREVDLRRLPEEEQRRELERMRVAEANSLIDLDSWPLFRACVVRHGRRGSTLLWNVHHMVADGFSQGVLSRELTARLEGAPPPESPISYRDYIAWREREDEEELAASRRYWREVFRLPYERPLLPGLPGVEEPERGAAFQFPVPEALVERVAEFSRAQGVTAFAVYFAAYMRTVHQLFERDDLVVGTPAAGRTRAEFQNLVGNFISLVGVRHRRGEAGDFASLVRLLQERTVAAMEHQDYQYDQVMADVGAPRDDDRFPLTTVFVSLVDTPAAQAEGLRVAAHRDLGCAVKFDLMGYLRRSGEWWALDLHTRRGLLDPERLEWVRKVFLDELHGGLAE